MTPGPSRGGLRAWAGAALVTPALLAFGLLRPDDGSVPFFVLLALAAVGYLATLYQVAKGLRPSGPALIACAALALAWRVPMLLAPPEPAADLRRYLWDAHLVRSGLSPYAVVPADPAFAHLRTDETWPVNNPDVPSPYPPGAQLFFLAATALGESARAIKLAALLCDALLALVVWRSLVVAGANPGWMLAYLWNPLVSLEIARHGHLDVAGALLVACAALALVRGRALAGTFALALSIAVKPLSLVLLPLLWRRVSRWHVVAASAVLLAVSLPFWDRHRPPIGSVPEVLERFRFNGPIFSGIATLAGPVAAAGFAVAAGLAVGAWARRRLSLASPGAWAWPMATTLLCAPLVYPWYLVWLAPFLVASQTMPLAIWTVSILGAYVAWRQVGVPWGLPAWVLVVEYGALLGAAVWLWRRNRVTRPTSARPTCPTPPASLPRS
jgi:alpha-1,6-mannosyltransferase